jgi:hypothetical protein
VPAAAQPQTLTAAPDANLLLCWEQYAPEVIRGIMPAGMADLVEVIVLANFTALPDNMYTVTLHDILARDKYPGEPHRVMARIKLERHG